MTPAILKQLNILLTNELTAVDQYTLHAALLKDWGFTKLAAHESKEASEERGHVETLLDRIFTFDGTPDMRSRHSFCQGKTVAAIFEGEIAAEKQALNDLRQTILICEKASDYATRKMALDMLIDEEGHLAWLESQCNLIKLLGLPNYLQSQT